MNRYQYVDSNNGAYLFRAENDEAAVNRIEKDLPEGFTASGILSRQYFKEVKTWSNNEELVDAKVD